MVQLPREYKNNVMVWFPVAFGCFFSGAGLVGILVGIVAVLLHAGLQAKLLPLGLGSLFFLAGIYAWIAMRNNYTRFTIFCAENGFVVTSEKKRRTQPPVEYRWEEVTGTQYEQSSECNRGTTMIYRFFSVETTRGPAFKVDQNQTDLDELVTVFNEQTPHLPYVWIPDDTFSTAVRTAFGGNPGYQKAPRPPRAVPPPLPAMS